MNKLLNKITLISFVLILVLVLSNFAFADTKDVVKVRIAHLFAEDSSIGQTMNWIANELEKRSDGRIQCETFPGAVAGGEKENIEDLLTGNLEICGGAGSYYYQYVPEVNIEELPLYDWASQEQANRILHGYWDKIVEVSAKKGFYPLALNVREFFGVWTRNPIKSLKEIKGMKFRSVPADFWIEVTKLYGAIPNPMPMSDSYMAYKTGVCDGGVGPIGPWVGVGVHEVLKCFTDTRLVLCRSLVLTSKKWIDSLPEDLRSIVEEVCLDSEQVNLKFLEEYQKKDREKMKAEGVTIIEYDQIDKQELKDLIERGYTFRDEFMRAKGPEVFKFYQDWLKYVEAEKAKDTVK